MLPRDLFITFHGIGETEARLSAVETKYFVSEDKFRHIVERLSDLEARHDVTVHVTFDDGNLSDIKCGLPVLEKHGRPAKVFVLAGRIGLQNYLDRKDLQALAASGMEIGSHGYDHVDWRTLDAAGQRREIVDARNALQDVIGRPVDEAALPFGRFDKAVLRHLKSEGYRAVYSSSRGLAVDSAWFVPRISITSEFDPETGLNALAEEKCKSLAYHYARRLKYRF